MLGKPSGVRSPAAGLVLRLCRLLKDEASKRQSDPSTPQGSSSGAGENSSSATAGNSNHATAAGGKGGKNASVNNAAASASSKQPMLESIEKSLNTCEAWLKFSSDPDPWGEDGTRASSTSPLSQLIKEQDDDLCGPKPVRPPPPTGDAMGDEAGMGKLAELAGGGLMSGRDILALIQGMGRL